MKDIHVIGNLTDDAIIKDWNGQRFYSFSIAENQSYTNKDGNKVEKTTYISCLKHIFGDRDTLGAYLKKGTQVYVRGDVSCKIFERNNGATDCSLNCKVDYLQLLSSSRKQENAVSEPQNVSVGNPATPTEKMQQSDKKAPNQASDAAMFPNNPMTGTTGKPEMPKDDSDDLPF